MSAIRVGFVSILVVTATVVVIASISWLPSADISLMMYLARMVTVFGRVPYLEIWDLHPPGAFLPYIAAGSIFGYSLWGARMADLVVMAVMLAATWAWVRPFGRLSATAAVAALALLHTRSQYILQRETVAVAPILVAVAVLARGWPPRAWQIYGAGAAFGFAATIKPAMIVGLPVVAAWMWRRDAPSASGHRWRATAWLVAGAMTPLALAIAYLIATGSWRPFLDMAVNYWPAYARLPGSTWAAGSPIDILQAALVEYVWAPQIRWIPVAAMGVWFAWRRSAEVGRQRLILFCAMAATYVFYVGLQGHFAWSHWIPYLYLIVPLSCLVLIRHRVQSSMVTQAVAVGFLIVVVVRYVPIPDELVNQLVLGHSIEASQIEERVIADTLVAKGGPAIRVQPFGGVWADSMLMAGSAPATAIVSDVPFLPLEKSPYMKRTLESFWREFDANPPDVLLFQRQPRTSEAPIPAVSLEGITERLRNYRLCGQSEHTVMFERIR